MKQEKQDIAELRRKFAANPEYKKSLEEDAQIILAGEKAGQWKTLEEIEEERKQRKETV